MPGSSFRRGFPWSGASSYWRQVLGISLCLHDNFSPPPSSACVPRTCTPPASGLRTLARAAPAPALAMAIRLWPHAWPRPGKELYSDTYESVEFFPRPGVLLEMRWVGPLRLVQAENLTLREITQCCRYITVAAALACSSFIKDEPAGG